MHFGVCLSLQKSPPDVPGGRCRHAVLAAALADAKRIGSYLLTYAAVQIVSIVAAMSFDLLGPFVSHPHVCDVRSAHVVTRVIPAVA